MRNYSFDVSIPSLYREMKIFEKVLMFDFLSFSVVITVER